MGRGKRRTAARVTVAPVGARLGRYAAVTADFVAGDKCERECPRHGLTTHTLRVEKGTGAKRWRCGRCDTAGTTRQRQRRKETLVSEAGGKCVRCGYDRYLGALQFHHRDPAQKSFGLTTGVMLRHSMNRLREEAAKCDLLCGNCHAEVEQELDEARIEGSTPGVAIEEEGKLYGDCGVHGRTEFFISEGGSRRRCKLCNVEAVRRCRQGNKERLIEESGGKCLDCGYAACRGALHFHHRDPATKSFSIAKAGSIAYERLRAEAEKCDLLCVNCHSERHAGEPELEDA